MKFLTLFYFFLFYSFIGWIIDSLYMSFLLKKFTNRSFLTIPFSPIYGFTAVTIISLNHLFKNNLISLFLISSLIAALIEYFSSLFFEKIYHVKWWDYSHKKFNLQGRICLENTIYWGLLSTILLTTVHPYVIYVSQFLSYKFGPLVILVTIAILLVDINHTFGSLQKFKETLIKPIPNFNFDKKIKRLKKSFPQFKPLKIKRIQI